MAVHIAKSLIFVQMKAFLIRFDVNRIGRLAFCSFQMKKKNGPRVAVINEAMNLILRK
jgi:hypothetical protein